MAQSADKDKNEKFDPGPITAYSARQTISKLTIGAKAVETDEQARPAFGKLNPYEHGILPVLVVMQNEGEQTLTLEGIKAEYISPRGDHVEATPAGDVKYVYGPRKPKMVPSPLPRLPGRSKSKNPLSAWAIEGRAFSARMLPPGQSESGFFYFQTGHQQGSKLYLTGIREAGTGQELFFFEIPLEKTSR